MSKIIIRIIAVLLIISPWLYIGNSLKSLFAIVFGVILLLTEIKMDSKKNKIDMMDNK